MANLVYTQGLVKVFDGTYNWNSSTVQVMLVDSGYVPDIDHDFASTTAAHELSGTGYSRQTLTTIGAAADDTNDRCVMDANNVTFTGINAGTADAVVGFFNSGADATSPLIFYIDDGGFPVVTNGGDLIIQWSSDGVFYV